MLGVVDTLDGWKSGVDVVVVVLVLVRIEITPRCFLSL